MTRDIAPLVNSKKQLEEMKHRYGKPLCYPEPDSLIGGEIYNSMRSQMSP